MIPAKYWSPTRKLMLLGAMAGGKTVEATALGNPLTFITDVSKPLKSLLIPFSPRQEGSGDPSPENIRSILPWNGLTVFGGGKNLFDPSLVENGDIASNGVYGGRSNNRIINKTYIKLKSGTYTISNSAGFPCAVYAYADEDESTFTSSESKVGWNNTPTTFTLTNAKYVRFKWKNSDGTNLTPSDLTGLQLEAGSTASAYTPFVPITETPVVFPAMGKNLFNKNAVTNNVVWWKGAKVTGYSEYCATEKIPVTPGEDYRFVRDTGLQSYVSFFDSEGNYTGTQVQWTSSVPVRTIPEGVYFIGASMLKTSVDTAILTKGSEEVPYEPFTNTIYGGYVDIVTGEVWATHQEWSGAWSEMGNSTDLTNVTRRSKLLNTQLANVATATGKQCNIADFIYDYSRDSVHYYTSASGEKTYFILFLPIGTDESTQVQLCAELATPVLITTLTPQQITALVGDNTIWSDADGQMTAVYLKKG